MRSRRPAANVRRCPVERAVILQEIGQSLDTPDDVIFDWLQEVAYPQQSFGRTILGAPERVGAFGRDDLAGFVAEQYAPDRLILAAAGAVDPDMLLAAAERLFGHLAPRTAPMTEPARFKTGERRVKRRLEQAHVALAFEAPGVREDAAHAAQVYATALGGGMSSRLFQEAREKRGLCYTIFAQAAAFADTGLITIYAGTAADQIRGLEELVIDEMRRAADGFDPGEVARARAQMTAGLLMGIESPTNRIERLARMVAVWDRVHAIDETLDKINAVTPERLRDFAGGLVARAAPAVALLGPVGRAPALAAVAGRLAA
jgi:predicted Zn-dependent peptidase